MPLGEGSPHERGEEKRGTTLKGVILPLLALLTWKWLQIGTDRLLIITCTGDALLKMSKSMTLNDLELSKLRIFSRDFALRHTF